MASTHTSNPFIDDTETVRDRREETTDRPDLKAPPPSPEPDRRELERGLDRWESVKPY